MIRWAKPQREKEADQNPSPLVNPPSELELDDSEVVGSGEGKVGVVGDQSFEEVGTDQEEPFDRRWTPR